MKITGIVFVFVLLLLPIANAQRQPARIVLKTGGTIDAYDFVQKDCSGSSYFEKYIMIRGKYNGNFTEIKEYKKIAKIEFINFSKPAVVTGNNEKGTINIFKKNGVTVTLEEAEIMLSCYGVDEKHNQITIQTMDPLMEQVVETAIDTKDIKFILFPKN